MVIIHYLPHRYTADPWITQVWIIQIYFLKGWKQKTHSIYLQLLTPAFTGPNWRWLSQRIHLLPAGYLTKASKAMRSPQGTWGQQDCRLPQVLTGWLGGWSGADRQVASWSGGVYPKGRDSAVWLILLPCTQNSVYWALGLYRASQLPQASTGPDILFPTTDLPPPALWLPRGQHNHMWPQLPMATAQQYNFRQREQLYCASRLLSQLVGPPSSCHGLAKATRMWEITISEPDTAATPVPPAQLANRLFFQ